VVKTRAVLALTALILLAVAAPAMAADESVSIGDNFYSPATVTITEGDTVTWTNNGQAPHSVTADNGSFDSSPSCPAAGCMENGDTYSHTFSSGGTFDYFCKVHGQSMSGTVVVEAAGGGGGGGGGGTGGGGTPTTDGQLPNTGPEPLAVLFPAVGLLSVLMAGGLLILLRRRRA
jgi:LPXTG-motif cell wall-anchored protein